VKHGVNWRKSYCKIGDEIPVYPFNWRRKPFIGIVSKIKKNKYGRISYVISGMDVVTEELWPAKNQEKLKIKLKVKI
jgi:hypothetical protein